MLLVDGHEDLAFNAVELGRMLTRSVADIRRSEGDQPSHGEGVATVSLPALREAGARIVLATVFISPTGNPSLGRPGYATPDEAFARASVQINWYARLAREGEVTLLRNQRSLNAILDDATPSPGLSLVLEGADPVRTPGDLATFLEHGVRTIGLAWQATRYAGSTGAPGPLTQAGKELLHEMDRLGVMLDASHLAEEAFWQAVAIFKGRIIATHANCRAIVPGNRQLSDDMIRAIADRDGVIGLVCYNRFLVPDWDGTQGKMTVSLRDLLPHVNHMINLVGFKHVGLGSDMDGGIGRDDIPCELETASDLPRIADMLVDAGFAPDQANAIMGANWRRVLRAVLPE